MFCFSSVWGRLAKRNADNNTCALGLRRLFTQYFKEMKNWERLLFPTSFPFVFLLILSHDQRSSRMVQIPSEWNALRPKSGLLNSKGELLPLIGLEGSWLYLLPNRAFNFLIGWYNMRASNFLGSSSLNKSIEQCFRKRIFHRLMLGN